MTKVLEIVVKRPGAKPPYAAAAIIGRMYMMYGAVFPNTGRARNFSMVAATMAASAKI
jgi:hypothetical protein